MKRVFSFLAIMFLLVLTVLSGCVQKSTEKKPVPQSNNTATSKYSTLMDEAGADTYTNGCVSCHKKTTEVDRSLPAYVKRIEGHPEVKEGTVNACYDCHEAQKNYEWYKSFYRGIHKAHWKSNTFYVKLKGKCYACHTVESNGVSGIKEYPLAGYRTAVGTKKVSSGGTQNQAGQNRTGSSKTQQKSEENKTSQDQQSQSKSSQSGQSDKTSGGKIPQSSLPGFTDIPTPTP